MTTETIHFSSPDDKSFKIDTTNCISYHATNKFSEESCKKPFIWHQIIVHHHNRKYSKEQILKSLFDTVGNVYFFPIAYKQGSKSDKFLVRKSLFALQKLFYNKLLLRMSDNHNIELTVKLNVGTYEYDQINPESKINKAIMKRFNHLTNHNRVKNVLNLEKFALSPELNGVQIDLGSEFIFNSLCEIISKQDDVLNSINGLNLSNNNIKYLSPMKLFAQAKIKMIDLRLNKIKSMNEIDQLNCIHFTDLYISGNPIEKNETNLFNKLKQSFPSLLETDIYNKSSMLENDVVISTQTDSVTVEENGLKIEVNDLLTFERYRDSNSWHKITIVHHGKYTKKEITEAFFEFFTIRKPEIEFFPCYYTSGPTEDTFLVRHCDENLKLLMENDLKLPISKYSENLQIKLTIEIANFNRSGHVVQDEIILSSAGECFNIMDRCLNLENFSSSKLLKNLILNMGNCNTNFQILKYCGRKYTSSIIEVRLNKNKISNCKGLKALDNMINIKVLDLRDNMIKTINDLEFLPKTSKNSIKEIRLDGNPLCKNYPSSTSYIKAIKTLFPNINKLDGTLIVNDGGLISKKNYLNEMEYYDLVEQFVSNYFKAYDNIPDRKNMKEMYDENAIFTISLNYDTKNIYTQYRIKPYQFKQRNLKTPSYLSNIYKNLYIGNDQISSILSILPKTEHDFFSLTTDTTKLNTNLISITVTGVFKDIPEDIILENEVLLAFSRTFIIRSIETNMGVFNCTTEYKIVNEHLNICGPTLLQSRNTFKYETPSDNSIILANTSEEKELFIIMFEQIVGVKRVWCTRCLNDGNWNFKKSLEVFMSLMSTNQIPKTAFIELTENN